MAMIVKIKVQVDPSLADADIVAKVMEDAARKQGAIVLSKTIKRG